MSRKPTPHDVLADELHLSPDARLSEEQLTFLHLVRTTTRFMNDLDRLFKAHGLSEPLYNALRIVSGSGPEGLPSQSIGERMIRRDPDVTRLVNRLEHAGLVSRARSEVDRRCIFVRITPKGARLLNRLEQPVLDLHREQLGHMTAAQLNELNGLLVIARNGSDVESDETAGAGLQPETARPS